MLQSHKSSIWYRCANQIASEDIILRVRKGGYLSFLNKGSVARKGA